MMLFVSHFTFSRIPQLWIWILALGRIAMLIILWLILPRGKRKLFNIQIPPPAAALIFCLQLFIKNMSSDVLNIQTSLISDYFTHSIKTAFMKQLTNDHYRPIYNGYNLLFLCIIIENNSFAPPWLHTMLHVFRLEVNNTTALTEKDCSDLISVLQSTRSTTRYYITVLHWFESGTCFVSICKQSGQKRPPRLHSTSTRSQELQPLINQLSTI